MRDVNHYNIRRMSFKSIIDLFEIKAAKYAKLNLISEKGESLKGKVIETKFTFDEIKTQVKKLKDVLESFGQTKSHAIAIWSYNSYRWLVADLAIMSLGAVTVGVHPEASDVELAYILKATQVQTIFIYDQKFLNKLKRVLSVNKLYIRNIIISSNLSTADDALSDIEIHIWDSIMSKDVSKSFLRSEKVSINIEDPACIVCTAGTGGLPKLIQLSHKALLNVINDSVKSLGLSSPDVFFSVNSFSIITERVLGPYSAFLKGFSLYIPADPRTYLTDLEFKNITVCSVTPPILNQIQERIFIDLNSKPLLKFLIKIPLLNLLAKAELKKSLAPKLKFFISYGDALSPKVEIYLRGFNLKIVQCFSLAEAAGLLAIRSPHRTILGSCGKLLNNVQVKIFPGGEIACTGENVIKSYYSNPNNADDFLYEDNETWFNTGDLGSLRNKNLFVSAKQRDIIISGAGKKILVNSVEVLLEGLPYVINAVVVGQNKEFLSVLISVNEEVFRLMYQKVDKYSITRQCEIDLEAINQNLSSTEEIHKFSVLDQPLSIARGELTPTLKKCKKTIEENYKDKIAALYN
jgi:long-chain acyl-CoA synthetase